MGKPIGSWGSRGWMPGSMGWSSGHYGKWILIGLALMAIMANKRMWHGEGWGMPGMMGGRWGMGGPGMMGGVAPWRHFVSSEEKISKLEEYLKQLQQEEKGVQEKIEHLRTKAGEEQ
jgi:hypothetical protein